MMLLVAETEASLPFLWVDIGEHVKAVLIRGENANSHQKMFHGVSFIDPIESLNRE